MVAGDFSHLLLPVGVFAGAMVSGFTGFAFSAVAGAVLLHALPPGEAVPLMMVCSVLVQAIGLVSLWRHVEWRASATLVAGGLLGLPPALYVLLSADPTLFRVGFGVFLAAYAGYMLARPAVRLFQRRQGWRYDATVGLAGGLVGGLTAMPGAVLTIWCDLRGLAKERQRGLVQPYIAAMQIAALALLAMGGKLPEALIGNLLSAIAPLAAGALVGLALFGRVNDVLFRRLLLGVLLISGLAYVIPGASEPMPRNARVPTEARPTSIAIDPSGRFAYVANIKSNNISAYRIDGASGTLHPVAGSPFAAGLQPFSVALAPSGAYAVVANQFSNNLSVYQVDDQSGALRPVAGSPFPAGTRPFTVTLDPSGRFAYVANMGSSDVSAYRFDARSGALTPLAGSPFKTGRGAISVSVDPAGRFAYVANMFSNDISAYRIDRASGALTRRAVCRAHHAGLGFRGFRRPVPLRGAPRLA